MNRETVIAELETLAVLLPVDGWGEHYVIAVNEAARILSEASKPIKIGVSTDDVSMVTPAGGVYQPSPDSEPRG